MLERIRFEKYYAPKNRIRIPWKRLLYFYFYAFVGNKPPWLRGRKAKYRSIWPHAHANPRLSEVPNGRTPNSLSKRAGGSAPIIYHPPWAPNFGERSAQDHLKTRLVENRKFVYRADYRGLPSASIIARPSKSNTVAALCPNCGSIRQNLIKLPSWCDNDTLRCGGCDLFQGLTPKPKNQRTRRSGRGGARWKT